MILKNFTLLIVLFLFFSVKVFAQELVWAKSMGGSSDDLGYSLAVDDSGSVFTTGLFSGTADFDPSIATFNLTSNSNKDVFITKFDKSGNLQWAKSFGGAGDDFGVYLTVDQYGNTYTTGYFSGTVDFDPGSSIFNLTSSGSQDIFIVKLDKNGNFAWAKKMGGSNVDMGFFIELDNHSNIYITGWYSGTADFDPGSSTHYMTASNENVFISKLDSNGSFIWAKNIGGSSYDRAYEMAISNSGMIYITGDFVGTADFDPSSATHNLISSGSNDIFVTKLDTAGNFIWAKKLGGSSGDFSYSMELDLSENILITGQFSGTADFDPNSGTTNLISRGAQDIHITKLDSAGNLTWAKNFGSSSSERGRCIDVDTAGNVYVTGKFQSTVDFDPSSNTFNLSSKGDEDQFVLKLNPSANFEWVVQFGGSNTDNGHAIDIDIQNNVYVGGYYQSTVDFNPDPSTTYNLSSNGLFDISVVKLFQCTNSSSVISAQACESYISPSGKYTWTVSGTYKDTIQNAAGCDSLITIGLLIHHDNSSVIFRTACDSLTSPSGKYTWTVSGTYTDTISTVHGCDSTMIIGLTIDTSSHSFISISACNSHTSPSGKYNWTTSGNYMDTIPNSSGCDSILSIQLSILNDVFINTNPKACNSYTSPSGKYNWTTSGTYGDTISTALGCDTIFNIQLSINKVDTSVYSSGPMSLTANALGAIYQWVDCNNNYAALSGKTHQSYTASGNGNYAVIISQFNCTDTSSCYKLIKTGIADRSNEPEYLIYPNPAKDQLFLETAENGELSIYSSNGQLVYNSVIKEQLNLLDISKLNNGLYHLKFFNDKSSIIKKLIIAR